MERKTDQKNFPFSRFAVAGFALAVLAGLAAALAGFGTRWGMWDFRTGFAVLRWAAYGGIAAAAISFVGCIWTRPGAERRGLAWSIIGLLIGLVVLAIPWSHWREARRVPAIHDITTDTGNPPRFVTLLPIRKNATNPSEYGGPEIAAAQHAAYPDIQPLLLPLPPDQAFVKALQAARSMGWNLIAADQARGRIEATDTTFWFGFKDDIVIRVTPGDHGSRIDVRSVSRVGKSDVGTNAKRIRRYMEKLKGIVSGKG